MPRPRTYATTKLLRQRMRYWEKQTGIDKESAIILATSPKYVVDDFRAVRKLHGTEHAVSWLKGAHGHQNLFGLFPNGKR